MRWPFVWRSTLDEAVSRNQRLLSRMRDATHWLGEFPDVRETLIHLLNEDSDYYRQLGEPATSRFGDVSDLREYLRRSAIAAGGMAVVNRERIILAYCAGEDDADKTLVSGRLYTDGEDYAAKTFVAMLKASP